MKKISIAVLLFVVMAFLSALISSAFTTEKSPDLFIAPSVAAIDYFYGDPVKIYEMAQDDDKKIENFKIAGQRVSGANLLGAKLSDGRITRNDINKDDASAHFEYEAKAGSLSFSKGLAGQLKGKGGRNLPDDKKAELLANKFLTENDLAPEQKEQLEMVHVGGIKRVSKEGSVDILKTVSYARKIDGVPVSGPGSKIVVKIGNDGEILAVQRKWRNVKCARCKSDQHR